ncbi:hypothetical protein EZV62_024998 [Acer yangbiense]|uniref:Retroviral polymerase SH3-like domain-containing protein n=1 Tax=Acer yangbiense TaxID=1000413 RepID=A0A5C7GWK3_9ROSI|nr:hypothetical protein EZV62_024998 [Acer yangbiense]
MVELMRNPRVMKKAQAEVREVFGSKGKVDEIGLIELKFLKLVIKEAVRLHLPFPLIPRGNRESCVINGFDIPANSTVFITVWQVNRDPKCWIDLESFIPERCPTKSLDTKTPQEAWSSHKPSVSHLRVFGSIAYIKVPEARRTKLEDKGEKCILVGYGDRTMGYRLYNPVTKKVIFSRDVIFEENESWNWDQTKASRSAELMPEEETREMATEPQIPRDQQTPQRGSSSPQRYDAPLPIERDFSDMMPRGTRSLEDLYENTEQVEEDVTLYCLLMTSDPSISVWQQHGGNCNGCRGDAVDGVVELEGGGRGGACGSDMVTSADAEVAAILQACQLCGEENCLDNCPIIIESDSLQAVTLRQKVTVRFVPRSGNVAADFLAKQGATNGLVQVAWAG